MLVRLIRTAVTIATLGVTCLPRPLVAQNDPLPVDSLVNLVNVDSLQSYIRILSGIDALNVDDSVLVYSEVAGALTISWYVDTTVVLSRRVHIGNEVAGWWLERKLRDFGYENAHRTFNDDEPYMENVLAELTGIERPDHIYIIGAHYDGVPPAPAADDNASGTAAVLEAARILAGRPFVSTILFALWDSEEVGLDGSRFFAEQAAEKGLDIAGVINLDMIGWDGDKDRVVEVHSNEKSTLIAEEVMATARDLELDLAPFLYERGARNSDHASFWNVCLDESTASCADEGYPAVMLIEELRGGDFNPHYHRESDLLENIDLGYLTENARLGLAVIARLATQGASVDIEPNAVSASSSLDIWPNPSSDIIHIRFDADRSGPFQIKIYDVAGRPVDQIRGYATTSGTQHVAWRPPARSAGGMLIVRLEDLRSIRSATAVRLK